MASTKFLRWCSQNVRIECFSVHIHDSVRECPWRSRHDDAHALPLSVLSYPQVRIPVAPPLEHKFRAGMFMEEAESTVVHGYIGRACTWGRAANGKLGHGAGKMTQADLKMPFAIYGPLYYYSICVVACGAEHSVCITDNGRIFSWGSNKEGQLGVGDTKARTQPALIEMCRDPDESRMKKASNKKFTNIVCGMWHCLAITSKKKVSVTASRLCPPQSTVERQCRRRTLGGVFPFVVYSVCARENIPLLTAERATHVLVTMQGLCVGQEQVWPARPWTHQQRDNALQHPAAIGPLPAQARACHLGRQESLGCRR